MFAGLSLIASAVLMVCVLLLVNGFAVKLEQSRYDLTACEALKMELAK